MAEKTQEAVKKLNESEKVAETLSSDTSVHGFTSQDFENLTDNIKSVNLMHMPGVRGDPVNELANNQFLISSFADLEQTQLNEDISEKLKDNSLKESEDVVDIKPLISGDTENDLDNDDVTQQLMDEIDDIKPKSNMPFVKDGKLIQVLFMMSTLDHMTL